MEQGDQSGVFDPIDIHIHAHDDVSVLTPIIR